MATCALDVRQLGGAGRYALDGAIDPANTIHATLQASEPAHGLVAGHSRPARPRSHRARRHMCTARAVRWPRTSRLSAGPLHATADGTLDLEHRAADLMVSALRPRCSRARILPGRRWRSMRMCSGPFTRPDATGHCASTRSRPPVLSVRQHHRRYRRQRRTGCAWMARSWGCDCPVPNPDLLADDPLIIQADARLDAARSAGACHACATSCSPSMATR